MTQYIDKATIVEKIKRRFDEYSSSILKHYDACKEAKAQELSKILTILDTLEVKEVDLEECQKENIDLEKEVNQYFEKTWPFEEDNEDIIAFARHFFELGLKAQKL